MYKLEFINVTYENPFGVIKTLTEDEISNNFDLSAHKLYANSNFIKEPRCLSLKMFNNQWFEQTFVEENTEIERGISRYGIRVLHNSESIFTGYIDLNSFEIDFKTNTVSFRAYDALWVLKKYNDLETLFSLYYGYSVQTILGLFVNRIKNRTNLVLPYLPNDNFDNELLCNNLEIAKFDLDELLPKPNQYPSPDSYFDEITPSLSNNIKKFGFIYAGNSVFFVAWLFNNWGVLKHETQRSYSVAEIKVFKIHNKTCIGKKPFATFFKDYQWHNQDELQGFQWVKAKCNQWLYSTLGSNRLLPSIENAEGKWNFDFVDNNVYVYYTGNAAIEKIFPNGFYDGNNKTANIAKAINACLILQNKSLFATNSGALKLKNQTPNVNSFTELNNSNIAGINLYRRSNFELNLSDLDILAGNALVLKQFIASKLDNFGYWEVKGNCLNNLKLYDVIKYNQIYFKIIEIKQAKIGYQFKACEVNV